jgi:hypothetical protein
MEGRDMTSETSWLPAESKVRDFPWLWVWIALVVSLSVGGVILYELWGKGTSEHQDAFDAAWKTAAGVLAILATFITVHRLRLSQAEHRLRESADNFSQSDAIERRIIELFTKASDQLGSDKPAVRLAGLHALERLGQSNPSYRQTVVNVICAYLRMPFTLPSADSRGRAIIRERASLFGGADTPGSKEQLEELQVRQTAQQILRDHLNPGRYTMTRYDHVIYDGPVPGFWPGMSIDLSDATLMQFNLGYCELGNAGFRRTRFFGITSFSNIKIRGFAEFGDAEFSSIPTFNGADIGDSYFGNAFCRDMIPFLVDPVPPKGYYMLPVEESEGKYVYYFTDRQPSSTDDDRR